MAVLCLYLAILLAYLNSIDGKSQRQEVQPEGCPGPNSGPYDCETGVTLEMNEDRCIILRCTKPCPVPGPDFCPADCELGTTFELNADRCSICRCRTRSSSEDEALNCAQYQAYCGKGLIDNQCSKTCDNYNEVHPEGCPVPGPHSCPSDCETGTSVIEMNEDKCIICRCTKQCPVPGPDFCPADCELGTTFELNADRCLICRCRTRSPCEDEALNCAQYQAYCGKGVIDNQCSKTCDDCYGDNKCEDYQSFCDDIYGSTSCTKKQESDCPRSCGACKHTRSSSADEALNCAQYQAYCGKGLIDNQCSKTCDNYNDNNKCENYRPWCVLLYGKSCTEDELIDCPKSCGICNYTCEDSHPSCALLNGSSCTGNETDKCPKSCGAC